MKPDAFMRRFRWRQQQRTHLFDNISKRHIVTDQGLLDRGEALLQDRVGCHFLAQTNKGPDNIHAHGDGVRTVENVGGLKCAMLGEGPGQCPPATAAWGRLCYRNLRCQRFKLFFAKLEAEVVGKAGLVALHGLVEPEGLYAIETCQIDIQDDALTTDLVDQFIDGDGKANGFFHDSLRLQVGLVK